MTTDPTAADRQPAYDAVFAYIRQQPRDFLPTNVVDRNAMIWRAVNVALDAVVSPPTDRADLRERIAGVLAEADGWKWVTARDKARSSTYRSYQSRADAVLAVLGEPTDRAAVYAEVADRLAADAEQGDKDGLTRIYRRSAARHVRAWSEQLRRTAVEAHGTGTPQPCPGVETVPNRCTCDCEGCKHHCGAHNPAATQQQCSNREPLIGVQCSKQAGHEAHSDRPGRIWYPVADDTAQQQEPTDEDVVEAHRLALSEALHLGTGAPWDAIRDRAAELGAQQQPETEAPDELATARATNQRLNYEKQRLESELAAYRRAVRQWEVSERGTYIPHSSLRVIGNACGVDILGTVRHLKHFERVEQAEAAIERVRRIHTRGRRTNACNDCGQSWPCEVTRALDEPAPVAQQPAQDEALREGAVARCDRALAGKTHPPHDWEPDPGNGLWHCPGDEPFAI